MEKTQPLGAGFEGISSSQNATDLLPRPSEIRKRRQPERDRVLVPVCQHLGWRAPAETWWTHFPAGGRRSRITGAILKGMGTKAGVPDLLIVSRGRLFGLELKNGTRGRLSSAQVATHAEMRKAGAVIGTAGTLDEALNLLNEWGVI